MCRFKKVHTGIEQQDMPLQKLSGQLNDMSDSLVFPHGVNQYTIPVSVGTHDSVNPAVQINQWKVCRNNIVWTVKIRRE